MEFINNRLVNLWRGSNEPPTKYHIWINNNKLLIYNGEEWAVFVEGFNSLDEIRLAIKNVENLTVNGKAIKDNPVLSSLDILIGLDLENFDSNTSLFEFIKNLDESFGQDYSIKVTLDLDGNVVVFIGDHSFKILTTGESISLRTKDNTIIIDSEALTSVPTETPLEWTDKKLIHSDSGVEDGTYGETSDRNNADTVQIPKITVDKKGHIKDISNVNITIRDYVDQLKPDDSNSTDKPILLAYTYGNEELSNPVRQASGLTYNDKSGELKTKGSITTGGGINVDGGDLVVKDGYKIYGDLYGSITGTAIPKIHSSEKPNYGAASKTLYGHVIILDELSVIAPPPSNDNTNKNRTDVPAGTLSVAASPLMVWNALQEAKQFTRNYFSDDFEEKDNKVYLRWEEIK